MKGPLLALTVPAPARSFLPCAGVRAARPPGGALLPPAPLTGTGAAPGGLASGEVLACGGGRACGGAFA